MYTYCVDSAGLVQQYCQFYFTVLNEHRTFDLACKATVDQSLKIRGFYENSKPFFWTGTVRDLNKESPNYNYTCQLSFKKGWLERLQASTVNPLQKIYLATRTREAEQIIQAIQYYISNRDLFEFIMQLELNEVEKKMEIKQAEVEALLEERDKLRKYIGV